MLFQSTRGPTSVRQADITHTGQATLLCHPALSLRAFRKVAAVEFIITAVHLDGT